MVVSFPFFKFLLDVFRLIQGSFRETDHRSGEKIASYTIKERLHNYHQFYSLTLTKFSTVHT